MGSQSKINLAYIAGFLDGDGSLMIQIKKRKDGNKKFRFMLTICFYQDFRHAEPLFWIKKQLGIGYISKRNDNITELRINGFKQVKEIVEKLFPYIRFKKKQAIMVIKAANILMSKNLSSKDMKKLVDCIISVQNNNYVTKKKRSKEEFYDILGLTP